MKNVNRLALISLVICFIQKGFSQFNNHHKNYIDIGVVGGMQHPSSALAGVYGSFGAFFMAFGKPASVDVRIKELYVTNPDQEGTLITFTYRISLVKGFFAGIGGAHGHQIMGDEFMIHPVSAIGGTNTHIMHGTGFNTEIGYNFNSFIKNRYFGIYPTIHASYTHLFMTNHSMPNLTLSVGLRVGFKQWN